jgi:formylglycine-generating enzyme required for sulfatase activity
MPPQVFLSYSHDSPEHKDRVLALCNRLRQDGLDAWIDQYETSPPEGWPRWCANQVRSADFVLVVCTEVYERRFRGVEEPGQGRGGQWEGFVIELELYQAAARNRKFIPVLFPPALEEHVPDVLRGVSRYEVGGDDGYWRLVRHLTGQPETPAPPLGSPVPLPPREPRTAFISPLGEKLDAAYQRLEELTSVGGETSGVRKEIRGLHREIRKGGLQAGDILAGRFKLLEFLGEGGFAKVWKAYDRKRCELVAVKILHGLHAEDRTRLERFFRGARKMEELRHEGIVRVLDSRLSDGSYHFFVMEYVPGGDLERAVTSGSLHPEKVLPLIAAVGEALAFAHRQGIVHRDVKPANILLDQDRPKLTDFDLVRALNTLAPGLTHTRQGMGTFLYTAPEVLADGNEAQPSADVYSLAMTAVFALSGKKLPLTVMKNAEKVIAGLPCSPGAREALTRAVSWELEERPGSIGEFCQELCRPAATPTPVRFREQKPGEERTNEKDGTVLVYVPGGEYVLGETSVHRVILSPFWIGKYPVTNEQYETFLAAQPGTPMPEHWAGNWLNDPNQPVVGVSWEEAQSYCRWAGLQLPSKAQWEAAARGTDQRRFPWGNDEPSPEHANFDGQEGGPTPVGTYPKGAGPFGTFDQAGNVWEWCLDLWAPAAYGERNGRQDPVSMTGDPAARCLRGGSWAVPARILAAAYRSGSDAALRSGDVGFRCLLPARPETQG